MAFGENEYEGDPGPEGRSETPDGDTYGTRRHELHEAPGQPSGGWMEPVSDSTQLMVSVSAVSTNDAELDAMQLCLMAAQGLNNQAKVRLVTWLTERLGAWRTTVPQPLPSGYPMAAPPELPPNPF